jgi:hexosaminidase
MKIFLVAIISLGLAAGGAAQTVSPLFARGYTVMPEPQKITLEAHDFTFGPGWRLQFDKSVASNDVAVEALRGGLADRFHIVLGGTRKSAGVVILRIAKGSVSIGKAQDSDRAALEEQAYRIDLHRGSVAITANTPTGLFYGVETFVQLLRHDLGTLQLPEGSIEDWPDLQLRQIYWDDNHHLDRMDYFKHALRQAAFYKINGLVVKLDGHFQYKSAPALVEPYALTPAQLQELTDYGLHYHVQLIPYLDGPAHISFILKHPEYAKLREYPDSNYEICATNPDSYKLLEGMYQDLLDANKGVKYFYQSTDESYYMGLAHNSQCNEEDMAKKLGSVGQVFAQFVDQADGYLHDHGRTVIFWGEYPLKPNDIPALPSYLVNGETYGPAFNKAFRQRGIRQLIFNNTQSGHYEMFPDYFLLPQSEQRHAGDSNTEVPRKQDVPRVSEIINTISLDSARTDSDLIGEINAGWADQGLHAETFWLGYVTSGAAGWHPGSPNPQELMSTFYPLFYGPRAVNMNRVYQLMSWQAQAWTDSWDTVPSTSRKPIWGSSYEIYKTPKPARDQSLPLPPTPGADLNYSSTWSTDNVDRINLAVKAMQDNDIVLGLLGENILRAQFNRYNLEVYLSIANLCRQNFEMIAGIHQMDMDLASAAQMKSKDPKRAIAQVDRVLDIAASIWRQRNEALHNTLVTWDETLFPRVAEANGRHYLDEIDDVKDHLPDRTVDMTYLVYREKILPFGSWVDSILAARNEFATAHQLPVRDYHLAWDDFSVKSSACSSCN